MTSVFGGQVLKGAIFCAWLAVSGVAVGPAAAMAELPMPHPNILFIIMDDVGIDQLQTFGYGGTTPPATPNITQIADAGIRFRNTWSMPACSPSRAVLFEGRYPMRTNVLAALGPNDLANSMVGPFEMTAPKLLKERDYQSALFGKFHLGLQGNSPFGYGMPRSLGWDYFFGWLDQSGDPSSIDTSAGGVAPVGTYSCGYVPGAAAGGSDRGAATRPTIPAASWRALVRTRLAGRAGTAEASSTRTSHARRSGSQYRLHVAERAYVSSRDQS